MASPACTPPSALATVPEPSRDPNLKTPRDSDGLLAMIDSFTGGDSSADLPLAALQEVTKHVATISRKAPPRLVQQKRQFVRGWYEDELRLRGHGVGAGPGGALNRSPSFDQQEMRLQNLDPAVVFAEVDARLAAAQRSITQSQLADVHVDGLAEQICSLLQTKVPTMMRDRRNLIMTWHQQQKLLQANQGGGGYGGSRW